MFQKHWDVLLVDDDEDILTSTLLAIKNMRVYGLPLRIELARSKAQAIELLESQADQFGIAVALVDVVMETAEAGLELCKHVRDVMGNRITQLVIRTGQAGLVPEKYVVDRYDINAYFAKADATEDKLYCVIKNCIRQYLWSRSALFNLWHTHELVASATSEEALFTAIERQRQTALSGATSEENWAYFLEGKPSLESGVYRDTARARADLALLAESGVSTPLGDAIEGYGAETDFYAKQGNLLLVRLVGSREQGFPQLDFVAQTQFEMPRFLFDMLYARFRSTRMLLKLASTSRSGRSS